MASRFAVATGNWNTTGVWSATSGGSTGASVPTAEDNVFFDSSSGAITVTLTQAQSCKTLDCTGFSGTIVDGGFVLTVLGDCIFNEDMTYTSTGTLDIRDATAVFAHGNQTFDGVDLNNTTAKDITIRVTLAGKIDSSSSSSSSSNTETSSSTTSTSSESSTSESSSSGSVSSESSESRSSTSTSSSSSSLGDESSSSSFGEANLFRVIDQLKMETASTGGGDMTVLYEDGMDIECGPSDASAATADSIFYNRLIRK